MDPEQHKALIEQTRAANPGDDFEAGYAARMRGLPLKASPWRQGSFLIHIAHMDWRAGWRQACRDLRTQPDLFL